jgi:hypothetical protein
VSLAAAPAQLASEAIGVLHQLGGSVPDDDGRRPGRRRLCESWSAITGQDKRQIMVSVKEVDPTSVMEAGLIMPPPGEETIWIRQHAREL